MYKLAGAGAVYVFLNGAIFVTLITILGGLQSSAACGF